MQRQDSMITKTDKDKSYDDDDELRLQEMVGWSHRQVTSTEMARGNWASHY